MRALLPLLLLLLCTLTILGQNCGKRKLPKGRIIGGNEVPAGKWPWQVKVDYGCGGTIIAPRWILTAAHCFARRFITDADIEDPAVTETDIEDSEDANTDIEDPEVSENTDPRNARANNADSDDDGAYYNNSLIPAVEIVYGNKHGYETNNTIISKSIIVHEKYVSYGHKDGNHVNDIALIELEEPLPFGRYVQTVCLPSKKTVIPRDGQVFATGFGFWNDRAIPDDYKTETGLTLRETVFPLIPKELCSDRLMKVETPLFSGDIPDTQLCGGSFGHGTAKADSGGPLVMRTKKGVWFQVGITSWGNNGVKDVHHQDDSPGVYTNVHEYCDWIKEKTGGEAKCRDAKLVDATS